MATLYELTGDYLQLMDMIDDPDVDEQALADTMEAIEGDIRDKANGYGVVIKNMQADADALKIEAERLTKRRQTIENNIRRMKENMQRSMELTGQEKINTGLFSFAIQKNPASVVMDEQYVENIPEEYLVHHEPTVNKTLIKNALKAGVDLEGIAHLEQTRTLRIR